jgi:hypothetical protein
MAVIQSTPLAVPGAVAAGAAIDVANLDRKAVYCDGTFVGTAQIQISPDATGTRWFNEGAAFTAAGVLEITKPARRMRVNVTAWTSGLHVITCCGVANDS